MPFFSYTDISKRLNWGSELETIKEASWQFAERGLLIRQTEAMEKMAENYQHLLDEVERYRNGYRDQKNRAESLENEIRQLKSVASRYRNQRDRIKEQMQENAYSL